MSLPVIRKIGDFLAPLIHGLGIKVSGTTSGSASVKAPTTGAVIDYILPDSLIPGGKLQTDSSGNLAWVIGTTTVWYNGTGVPSNSLGLEGDYYLDNATGDVYQKTSGAYVLIVNLKGTPAETYIHTQNAAASTWTVTHNLSKFPSVSVVDSGGTVVIGDVTYVDSNTLTIDFSAIFSGKAYLN